MTLFCETVSGVNSVVEMATFVGLVVVVVVNDDKVLERKGLVSADREVKSLVWAECMR